MISQHWFRLWHQQQALPEPMLTQIHIAIWHHWTTASVLIISDDSVQICYLYVSKNSSMAQYKTAVSPLLTHWRYCSLALSHRHILTIIRRKMGQLITHSHIYYMKDHGENRPYEVIYSGTSL